METGELWPDLVPALIQIVLYLKIHNHDLHARDYAGCYEQTFDNLPALNPFKLLA